MADSVKNPQVPEEIIVEILKKTPSEALCKFLFVSKQWRKLVDSIRVQRIKMADNVKKPQTTREFGEQIKDATLANKLIVIFFDAKWSGKCRYMLGRVERELAVNHSDVVFIVVDVVSMPELHWEWVVDCFPYFILVKQERIVDRLSGPFPEELNFVIEILKKRTVFNRRGLKFPKRRLKR